MENGDSLVRERVHLKGLGLETVRRIALCTVDDWNWITTRTVEPS